MKLDFAPKTEDVFTEPDDSFLHSSGHMAVVSLVEHCKQPKENSDKQQSQNNSKKKPYIVLVTSMSKCKCKKMEENKEDCANNKQVKTDKLYKQSKFETRDGYRFWKGWSEKEKTRKEPFFSRDQKIKEDIFDGGIALYNPREDEVKLSTVDDIYYRQVLQIEGGTNQGNWKIYS